MERKKKKRRTCDEDLDLVAEDGTDGVTGDALVDPRVLPSDGLDFVDGLRREFRLEDAVLHPSVLWLRVTWAIQQTKHLSVIILLVWNNRGKREGGRETEGRDHLRRPRKEGRPSLSVTCGGGGGGEASGNPSVFKQPQPYSWDHQNTIPSLGRT